MFYALSKTLDLFFSPVTWVILVSAFGLAGPRFQSARFACGASAALLYLFSTGVVANGLLRHLERSTEASVRASVTYDAAIVLGGAVDHAASATWGEPSYNDSVERLLVAFDLLRTGRVKSAILCGGRAGPDDPVVEAAALAKQLEAWGIDSGRLLLEETSRNTREDAVEAKRIVTAHGFNKVVLVTSAFHMPRASAAFTTVGLAVDLLPVDHRSSELSLDTLAFLPRASSLEISALALREIFGGIVYGVVWHGG